jgi:protein-disulfide isomerase
MEWLLPSLTACAVVVTALAVYRQFSPDSQRRVSSTVKDWSRYANSGHVMGTPSANVTIVEFADFQCPFCARFALYVDSLESLGLSVKVVFRHYPLPSHRHALPAARASECAAAEVRFESMHDALFAHPDSIGVADWWWFAIQAGFAASDSIRFRECTSSESQLASVGMDTLAGQQLGIRGTPLLLIEEQRLAGVPSFDSLQAYVRRASARNSRR